MNSVYVIKQAEFIVNTQNELLTAPEWHILLHILALLQNFLVKCRMMYYVVFCDTLQSILAFCFKNHREQNLRDLIKISC